MQFIPLTNKMGYEFAMINSLLQFLFWGFLLFSDVSVYKIGNQIIIIPLLLFTVPICISLSSEIILGFCSFGFGLKYYFLFVLPSSFLGFTLFLLLKNTKFKHKKLLFYSLTFIIILDIVIELFLYPQIYFYNLILAYFPGTIYDELIKIDSKLIYSRLIPILLGIIIISITNFIKKDRIKFFLVFLLVIMSFMIKPLLGLNTSKDRLKKHLAEIKETEHFIVYYDNSIDSKLFERINLLHEYYFLKVREELGFQPINKIESFIYSSDEQKGKLFGSRAADVTKPWLYQIHININSVDRNLLHEIIHVFSAEIGVSPLKLANGLNPAIIEGFAMAIEEIIEPSGSLDEYASLGISYYNINPNYIFNGLNFFSYNSSLGYILSGSFIKYLYSEYGRNKVFNFYKFSSLEKSFNENSKKLYVDYLKFINSLNLPFNKNKAIYFFGYSPLVNKKCARYIAYRYEEIRNIFENKRYRQAANEYKSLFEESNSLLAFNGYIVSLIMLREYKTVKYEISKILDICKDKNIYFSFRLLYEKTNIILSESNYSGLDELLEYNISENYNFEIYKIKELLKYNEELMREYLVNEGNFSFAKIKIDSLKFLFISSKDTDLLNTDLLSKNDSFRNNRYYRLKIEKLSDEYFLKGDYESAKKLLDVLIKLNIDNDKQCLYFSKLQKLNWFIKKRKNRN